jgi:hypothetical protein
MRFLLMLLVVLARPASAADNPDARTILSRATEAAGGDGWANADTLVLQGRAVFWGPAGAAPRSIVDDYRMWRVFDHNRTAAHSAEGKVRIVANNGGKPVWTVGFDGVTTWNEKGVIPADQAAAFWASNFGFGIIRRALDPGFKAERIADTNVDGHATFSVRLTDPTGGVTLFGIDKASYAIRSMGFTTPRGWHVRTYQDFVTLKNPRWLQARKITLYYNGAKQNEIYWQRTQVNVAIDDALFAPPK